MAPVLEGKSVGFLRAKNSAKRRALDLENQESGYYGRTKVQSNSRIQFDPNWFLGNWTLDLRPKWALFPKSEREIMPTLLQQSVSTLPLLKE
jgi:hypothetical protein